MRYLVSGYCLVPVKAEIEVEADTPAQAMKLAKAEWKRDHRSLLVPGSDDEGSACDWHPTVEPQTN
jgi:hypothetical protein